MREELWDGRRMAMANGEEERVSIGVGIDVIGRA